MSLSHWSKDGPTPRIWLGSRIAIPGNPSAFRRVSNGVRSGGRSSVLARRTVDCLYRSGWRGWRWGVSSSSRSPGRAGTFRFPGPAARAAALEPRGRQIFYMAADRKMMLVQFHPAKARAGLPRVVFQTRIIAPNLASFQYDVAPDGRFLVNSFPSGNSPPLTVITGWNGANRSRSAGKTLTDVIAWEEVIGEEGATKKTTL